MNHPFYRQVVVFLGGLLCVTIFGATLLFVDVYWRRPVTTFIWRDIVSGEECNGTVLKRPDVSQLRILDFAADAAVSLNSYDYFNQVEIVSSALRQYFTPSGADNYASALGALSTPKAIRANYVKQTAYKSGEPSIREEGFLRGRRYWSVEVPIVIFRESNVQTVERRMLLTMLIVSLAPSPANPNGIGIDSVQISSLTTYGV